MDRRFHASKEARELGQILTPPTVRASADDPRARMEDFCDEHREDGQSPRQSSWYACDQLPFSLKYAGAEKWPQVHVYAVEMQHEHRHPMCIVDQLMRQLYAGRMNTALQLVREYWRPKQVWQFWEYLSPTMVALEMCNSADGGNLQAVVDAYKADKLQLAKFIHDAGGTYIGKNLK